MTTFSELGLSDSIVSSLTELGFEEPTPIQNEAIPALLTGADVLGRAATGTGKTAAFSLPLLERHVLGQEADAPLVLVLTPTRELCLQVSEAFHNYGRKAGVLVTPIYGGQDYSRQIRALRRGTHVVVATPGRALDHIGRGTLDLTNIKAVVLDEADEMLDLGFADELDAIFDALPGHVQTALFSATLPPKIARIAEARLVDPVRITIAKEKTAEGETPRVPQIAYVVGHNYRTTALGRILDLEAPELAIIFTRTRMEVDDLTESLRARRLEMMRGSLAEILEAGDLDRFRVVVESLCEEYDPFDVAAAAMKLAQENEGANDDDTEIPAYSPFERPRRERGDKPVRGERAPRRERREAPEEGMTRLFVGAGRDLGIRPSDIVGAIANEAGVPSKCIGAIDITDRFTIVEVDSDRVEQIIDAMEGVRFKGRETTVKLDRPRREPREDRGDFRIEGRGEGRGEYRRERGEDRGWQQRDDSREYRGAKTKRDFRREGGYDKRGPRR